MDSSEELNSLSQGCFFIPCAEPKGETAVDFDREGFERIAEYELTDEPRLLRKAAYDHAWARTSQRICNVLDKLQEPVLQDIAAFVEDAYSEAAQEFYLPRSGLPTGILSGVTDAPSYTLRALLHALSAPRRRYGHTPVEGQHSEEDEAGPSSRPLAAHQSSSPLSKAVCLSSQDCPSLHAALRILIARFRGLDIGRAPADEQELDRPISTAKHAQRFDDADLSSLEAWYEQAGYARDKSTKLVVVFEDLEAFNSEVLQDLIEALSVYAERLPLVLVIGIATFTETLHSVLTRSTLARLEVEHFRLAGGTKAFEAIMQEVFLDWTPNVFIGDRTYELICSRFFESNGTIDSLVSSLQVAYLHHFTSRPLSAFTCSPDELGMPSPPPSAWSSKTYARLRLDLLQDDDDDPGARIAPVPTSRSSTDSTLTPKSHLQRLLTSDAYLLENIGSFRESILQHTRYRSSVLGVLPLLQKACRDCGSASSITDAAGLPLVRLIGDALAGALSGTITSLILSVKKLTTAALDALLDQLEEHVLSLPVEMQDALSDYVAQLRNFQQELVRTSSPHPQTGSRNGNTGLDRVESVQERLKWDEKLQGLKRRVGDWLGKTLREKSAPFDTLPLHSIWYYNLDKHINLLLDPAPRTNLLVALFDPSFFLGDLSSQLNNGHSERQGQEQEHDSLLPDTCRAYALYRDSGRLINLADWYDAFAQGLEGERGGRPTPGSTTAPSTPKKRKRHARGAEPDTEIEADDAAAALASASASGRDKSEAPSEDQQAIIQARFARALNELALLGFFRRTRRKVDHVLKSVFDLVPEPVV